MADLLVGATYNDHLALGELLAPTPLPRPMSKVVVAAHDAARQPELVEVAQKAGVPVLIDPMTHFAQVALEAGDPWAMLDYGSTDAWDASSLKDMSVTQYQDKIKRVESSLKTLRKQHTSARKKVSAIEKEIGRVSKQAAKASTDALRRNFERQRDSKGSALDRAKDAEVKLSTKINDDETALAEARAKLAEAEAAERRKQERDDERKRKDRERKDSEAGQRHARDEKRARQKEAARESGRDREIDALHHRTTELESQLAAAERRAAPPEITVMFLAANPEDQVPLRLDRESREIQKRVRASEYRASLFFEWCLARQPSDLIEELNQIEPHVLHFSGHGSEDALVFEDADGHSAELTTEQLARLLSVGGDRIRLAIFNSCNSEAQARAALGSVELSIGMNTSIGDETAKTFAGQFYSSLGFGKSVGEAFRQAVFQVEIEHGEDHDVPVLLNADGVDPETVVLVNPGDEDSTQ